MKLVADTNVVLSGLLWLGNPGRLLEAAANGRVTLYTRPALITELTATLRLPKFAARIVPNDPDDDQAIACALTAHADLIVSGDSDLFNLKQHQDIRIVTAKQAIDLIQK